MKRKDFHSQLFRKIIKPDNPEYWQRVFAETLYRVDDMVEKNCSCMECHRILKKYKTFLTKLKAEKPWRTVDTSVKVTQK